MAFYQLFRTQKIPASVDEVWEFISSPSNLKRITPPYMGFDIITENLPARMYPGMIIGYKVKPAFGLKMNWLTEITQVSEKEFFIDEQRIGPYKIWHHQHRIKALDKGVLMTDLVTYVPPLAFLGAIANRIMIKNKLNEIFDYRNKMLIEIFGPFE